MKKKLISALLMGALFVSSTSVFVSCKDYDDDITDLRSQINTLDGTVKAQISKLETAQSALESAYKSGDDAMLAAARQAVATAKSELEAALASKSEVNVLEAAVIKAQTAVDQALKLIDEKANKADLTSVQNDLASVKANLATATGNLTSVQADLTAAVASISTMKEDVKKALTELSELATALGGQQAALETITDGATAIKSTIVDLQGRADELETQMKVLAGLISTTGQVDLSQVTTELANLRQTVLNLSEQINNNPGSQFNTIIVALSKALRSLVFIPHLYLDGIESIEYPWIGDTILKLYPWPYGSTLDDVGHHANDLGVLHGLKGTNMDDYLPNMLGRWFNPATKKIETNGYGKKFDVPATISTDREWIYGPVWPVQYHLNPSTVMVEYSNDAPSFNVLEPDVVYYNTRATASSLNITSPEKYEKYGEDENVFGASNGILTVGLKIAHPNLLAPWPTDETINPNGNTNSTVSYPANQNGGNQPFTGAKTDEAYDNAIYGPYSSWYGFARYKYNKNNTDNTIALQMHKTDDEGGMVTSDYALIVPTRVQLEGLIWNQTYIRTQEGQIYVEPDWPGFNYGPNKTAPNTRVGDEEGWAQDEYGDCHGRRIHVWDSPEEAIIDENGASIELGALDANGIDLTKYLQIHALKENFKKKETAPGVYDGMPYDIITLKYGEEKYYGLHYEFELVEWTRLTETTSDSRFATFSDWTGTENHTISNEYAVPGKNSTYEIVKDWNKTTSKTGVIIARNVTPDGLTTTEQSQSSVDREPLVRVMVKNAEGKVLLDGYILLHINYTPKNLVVEYPVKDREFDLCNGVIYNTDWAEFTRYILTDALQLTNKETGSEILAFDDWYWADCYPEEAGGIGRLPEDEKFVTPSSRFLKRLDDKHGIYQLKIYNFGDDWGNDSQGNVAYPPTHGSANEELATSFSNNALGYVEYEPYSAGTPDHRFHWYLSEAELEYLTHHKPEALTTGVKVTRWIRFVAKDLVRGREVNNYSAPYPYIWVKLTFNITRRMYAGKYKEKIDNRWFNWNPQSTMTTTDTQNGWSAWLIDREPAPQNGKSIKDRPWTAVLSNTLVKNHGELYGTLTYEGRTTNSLPRQQFKYYFTPKTNYTLTALNGKKYTITPENKNYRQTAPVVINTNTNDWDKLYCKYVPYTWNITGYAQNPLYNPRRITKPQDTHKYSETLAGNFTWNESNLMKTLLECAILYSDDPVQGKNAGVFNNEYLYAKDEAGNYTPIARIVRQEQNGTGTYPDAGSIDLIHYLPVGTTVTDVIAGNAKENVVLYDVLNAMGYPLDANNECDYDHAQKFINQQLRAWVGVVAVNECNVALYVEQDKYDDDNINTFLATWERPINLRMKPLDAGIDAQTQESTIYLIDYLKMYDWRGDLKIQDPLKLDYKNGYMYEVDDNDFSTNHFWFWGYYNVKGIELDLSTNKVYTNMHKNQRPATKEWVQMKDVTTQEHFEGIDANGNWMGQNRCRFGEGWETEAGSNNGTRWTNNPWNFVLTYCSQDQEAALEAYMGINPVDNAKKLKFGAIHYENNGSNMDTYDVAIPMKIFYEWGVIEVKPFVKSDGKLYIYVNGQEQQVDPDKGIGYVWRIHTTHGRD